MRLDYLMEALPIMGLGMLGVFLVVAVIAGVVAVLNKICK